ncbi:MAG: hypothetical protein HFI39_09570 [Lachnospiraceae bacterium]|nr:hypothetical protein [Lachnospiraceae bacterium]
MEYILPLIWWLLLVGGIACFIFLKKNRNQKAAQSGGDKQLVRQAVQLPGEAGEYPLVYAHWEDQESYGRSVKTTYYRFAAAFQDQSLWVIPLHIDKKTHQIEANRPALFTPAVLGKVTVKIKEKDGAVRQVKATLCDKQGHDIVSLCVDSENLRKNRWYPVNILQQKECEAFARFLTPLARQVADENPEVDAMLAAESVESFGVFGVIVSAIGVVAGIFLPPAGVVLCLLGLLLALVGKWKGAKRKKYLIINLICAVWSVFFCWLYFTYLFI